MRHIGFSLLTCLLCCIMWLTEAMQLHAQTAIDLHTGRMVKSTNNDNPLSKQRIMARDRALATQDSLQYNTAVARAFLLLRQDSLPQAQHELEHALRLQPHAEGNAVLRLNLAKIFYWRQQWRDAERTLRIVVEQMMQQLSQPSDKATATTALATSTHSEMAQTRTALYTEARYYLHSTLYQLQQYTAAIDSIQHFLRNTPHISPHDSMDQVALLGDCYLAQQRYEEAVHAYQQVLKHEANDVGALLPLTTALHQLKRDEEALLYLNRVLHNEVYDELLAQRAWILREMGNTEAALADYTLLITTQPQHLPYRIAQAELLLSLGQRAKARAAVRQLLHRGIAIKDLPKTLQQLLSSRS